MNLVTIGSYLVHNKQTPMSASSLSSKPTSSASSPSSISSSPSSSLPPAMLHAAIHQPTLSRCLVQVIERREVKDGSALAREVRAQMLTQKLPDPTVVLKLREVLQDQENPTAAKTENQSGNIDVNTKMNNNGHEQPSRGLKRKATGDEDQLRNGSATMAATMPPAVHRYYLMFEGFKDGEACDLLEFLKLLGKVPENLAKQLFTQLLGAVAALHDVGIIHGDLKLPNILVVREGSGSGNLKVKVKDFRYSTILTSGATKSADSATGSPPPPPSSASSLAPSAFPPPGTVVSEDGQLLVTTHKGSPAYLAPEVTHLNQPYDGKQADTYALGVILYTMLYGTYPITAGSLPELFELIRKGVVAFPAGPSNQALDLTAKLLDKDPKKRLNLRQALRHPWISHPANEEEQIVPRGNNACAIAAAQQKEAIIQSTTPNASKC